VRVQVLSDDIFRVSATPENAFTHQESLSVVLKPGAVKNWSVTETEDAVMVSTSRAVVWFHG